MSESPTTLHTTIQDAIDQEVLPALGQYAADYDVEAIADEVFRFDDGYDQTTGVHNLDRQGFYQAVGDDAFWQIAENHQIIDPAEEA